MIWYRPASIVPGAKRPLLGRRVECIRVDVIDIGDPPDPLEPGRPGVASGIATVANSFASPTALPHTEQ